MSEGSHADVLSHLRAISKQAAFNVWHAGVVAALLDTACGFAAATIAGSVLASHFSVRCLKPAVAETVVVGAHIVKGGRQQIFATAELFGAGDPEKPCALGDTLLVPTGLDLR